MRARGAQSTDIAVIVVAADDGVKPQTREAVDHAKAAEVPIARRGQQDRQGGRRSRPRAHRDDPARTPARGVGRRHDVRRRLGQDQAGPRRPARGDLLLTAEIEELTANPDADASGVVIESKLDPGRGAVVTVLVQRGTLKIGDAIVAGAHWGRVRAMYGLHGQARRAGRDPASRSRCSASTPCRRPASSRAWSRTTAVPARSPTSARTGSSSSSRRAAAASSGLAGDDLRPARRGQGAQPRAQGRRLGLAGGVRGRDREAAAGRGAGLDRAAPASAASPSPTSCWPPPRTPSCSASTCARSATPRQLADREGVEIRTYSVIYRAIDELRDAMQGMLAPETVEDVVGTSRSARSSARRRSA